MRVFACLTGIMLMVLCGTGRADDPTGAVDKPKVQVGDRWVYRKIDLWQNAPVYTVAFEVASVGDNEIRTGWTLTEGSGNLVKGATGTYVYDGQWGIASQEPFIESRQKRVFSPPLGWLRFPLVPGQSWEGKSVHPGRNGTGEVTEQFKATATGWDTVTVPAGTFKAIKVVGKGHWRYVGGTGATESGPNQFTVWYAPEAKRAVRSDYEDSGFASRSYNRERTELLEYRVQE